MGSYRRETHSLSTYHALDRLPPERSPPSPPGRTIPSPAGAGVREHCSKDPQKMTFLISLLSYLWGPPEPQGQEDPTLGITVCGVLSHFPSHLVLLAPRGVDILISFWKMG